MYKKEFHLVQKDIKLMTDLTQANREIDIHHIDYVIPENEPSKKGKCIQFIAKECLLHKINIHGGSANEWHEFLCECIKLEKKSNSSYNAPMASGRC